MPAATRRSLNSGLSGARSLSFRLALVGACVTAVSSPVVAQPEASTPSAESVQFLAALTGVQWEAQGEGFRSVINYTWAIEGRVLAAQNVLTNDVGGVIAHYFGIYTWNAQAESWQLWNATGHGEVQIGLVSHSEAGLLHRVDITGGTVDSYTSLLTRSGVGFVFKAVYGDKEAAVADVVARQPLRYSPAGRR